MKPKYTLELVSGYKLIINFLRIVAGSILLSFGCSVARASNVLFGRELIEDSGDFTIVHILPHLKEASHFLTCFLAYALIIFSVLEIIFAISLLYRKRWGAIGLFIMSVLWIPIELLFISKFLVVHRVLAILFDLAIVVMLANILRSYKYHLR